MAGAARWAPERVAGPRSPSAIKAWESGESGQRLVPEGGKCQSDILLLGGEEGVVGKSERRRPLTAGF